MEKICSSCGNPFSVPSNRKGNARKYCDSCQIKEYQKRRRKAKLKYNRLHPIQRGRVMSCNWCGKPFMSYKGMRYCSARCRRFARKEQNYLHQLKYQRRHGRTDKQRYFDNLGNSNLGEHCCEDVEKEMKKIKKEKRRLKI